MYPAGSGEAIARPEAFLVDVYETILTCDFMVLRTELPMIAGVEPKAWNEGFARLVPDLTCGRLSMAQGFEQILRACGVRPLESLVSERLARPCLWCSLTRPRCRSLITAPIWS